MLQAAGAAPRKDEGAARDRVVRNECCNPRAAYVVRPYSSWYAFAFACLWEHWDGPGLMVYDHAIMQSA